MFSPEQIKILSLKVSFSPNVSLIVWLWKIIEQIVNQHKSLTKVDSEDIEKSRQLERSLINFIQVFDLVLYLLVINPMTKTAPVSVTPPVS